MRLRLVLMGLLAAVLLAACGGNDDEAAPETSSARTATSQESSNAGLVAEAGKGTFAQGSSRVAFEATVTGSGGEKQSFTADGAFDFEKQIGRLSFSVGAGEKTELLYERDVVYARVPEGTLPVGRPWLKIDLETLGDVSGIDLAQLAQAGQATPAQYLRWLSAAKDVERVGEEEVRGVQTTHYRGVIDVKRLSEEQPALRRSLDGLDLDEVPTEVWIDRDGLLRRMTQEYELSSAGEKTLTSVTMELYDFGVEVDAEPPDPEEVFDVSDLIGGSS
jgi:hypothetical protein